MDEAVPFPEHAWRPIGQTSNQLILYHPPSHALSVQPHPPAAPSPIPGPSSRPPLLLPFRNSSPSPSPVTTTLPHWRTCPHCSRPIPPSLSTTPTPGTGGGTAYSFAPGAPGAASTSDVDMIGPDEIGSTPYFQILERAHEGSRPPSPRPRFASPTPEPNGIGLDSGMSGVGAGRGMDEVAEDLPAKGYYERYFREEARLGMGAEGSVYLATHVIGENVLVKKIAVGTSKEYLFKMLREVRLLEALRHPNIIPYHHSWIDVTRFSNFGPPITALHVLMMYATAGNLDTFLLTRSHATQPARPDLSAGDIADAESIGQLPKEERIKAFKKRRQSRGGANAKREETRGVLLLNLEEVTSLFGDIVEGLAFLHANSILHLDLKCSNVLLHWEEGKLIPKAMISDFGTSEEMLRGKRERTGHTGTMEYMAPETLVTDSHGMYRPSDSHADMWSLGMILHKLLFLHLPYGDTDDFDALHAEILRYPGFIPTPELIESCERRHIPRDLLLLLSKLVNVNPEARPTAERVRTAIRGLETHLEAMRRRSSFTARSFATRFARPFEHAAGYLRGRSPSVDGNVPGSVEMEGEIHGAARWREVGIGIARFVRGNLKGMIFVIKLLAPRRDDALGYPVQTFTDTTQQIMSLQPQLSKTDLAPALVLLLVLIALLDLRTGNTRWSAMMAVVHLAVMIGAGRMGGVGDVPGAEGEVRAGRAVRMEQGFERLEGCDVGEW
ncbi:hypothetical protein JCM24511_06875 [Saitozyma sp. JCM 24511]|nr:hypothetical protein JCM24511_06875 [Saitozyma sp. JCM 24511]